MKYWLMEQRLSWNGFSRLVKLTNQLINQSTKISLPVSLPTMFAKDDLQQRWWDLETKLVERFGKKPDMEAILFLIGIQEFGQFREKFTKEQKQDLMHVAVCSLLSQSGYYELERTDEEGWPHF